MGAVCTHTWLPPSRQVSHYRYPRRRRLHPACHPLTHAPLKLRAATSVQDSSFSQAPADSTSEQQSRAGGRRTRCRIHRMSGPRYLPTLRLAPPPQPLADTMHHHLDQFVVRPRPRINNACSTSGARTCSMARFRYFQNWLSPPYIDSKT